MTDAKQDKLYKHIGRYSTTHAKYVNENRSSVGYTANQFVSQLDRQSDIRIW
jgi:hypothetical protein